MTMPPVHPVLAALPPLSPDELKDLAEDIKANGLQQPIVLYGPRILDGRGRWLACEMAGVEPRVRDWNGDDPIAFVVSMNLKRRHLNESQRAMVAARIISISRAEARERLLTDAFSDQFTRAQRWVYFVRNERSKNIKIGVSSNPARRLQQLQTGCADKLTLALGIRGNRELEAHFHACSEENKLCGEWFAPVAELEKFIELAQQHGHAMRAGAGLSAAMQTKGST
jgi:ParB-like chromosome segregation protein Spo0J